MRTEKESDISIEDAETAIGNKIFRTIVNDYRTTVTAINKGQPLVRLAPRASIAKDFKELADDLLQSDAVSQKEAKQEKKWWRVPGLF